MATKDNGRERATALADLFEIAARILHSRGYAAGLYPAQWVGLRYFAHAEPARRTASELARYQGLANGPVSRTVRTLIAKNLIRKAKVQPKGRSELLEVTETGAELLKSDPLAALADLLSRFPADRQDSLALGLETVIRLGVAGDGKRAFAP